VTCTAHNARHTNLLQLCVSVLLGELRLTALLGKLSLYALHPTLVRLHSHVRTHGHTYVASSVAIP
jgi:hypothetical protein